MRHHPPVKSSAPIRWARYECKYLVADRVAEQVRRHVQAYVEPDPYAAASPDDSYRVSSLYLDTPALRLFHETQDGRENRIKLRVRRYSRDEGAPVFLEIKRRHNRVVEKARVRVDRSAMAALLDGSPAARPPALSPAERENYDEFVGLVEQLAARPIVHVGYQRQAYVGVFHPDVRVTFDREIACAPAGDPDVIELSSRWEPVETTRVVLELKFNQLLPAWMQELIQRFGLQRTSYSKYGNAVLAGSAVAQGYSSFLGAGR